VRRFKLADTVDVDTNTLNPEENPICVNVNTVNAPDDDTPPTAPGDTLTPGCPVDELPPDEIRFAHVPEATELVAEGGADDEWGEL
jgi:hypothetical protein